MTDFSSENLKARRMWHIFQVLKEKNCQPRVLYPVKIFFRNEKKIKTFSVKGKVKALFTIRPILRKWLKGILETERKL